MLVRGVGGHDPWTIKYILELVGVGVGVLGAIQGACPGRRQAPRSFQLWRAVAAAVPL